MTLLFDKDHIHSYVDANVIWMFDLITGICYQPMSEYSSKKPYFGSYWHSCKVITDIPNRILRTGNPFQ